MNSNPKNIKIIDNDFLKQIRNIPCLACGSFLNVEAHHIKSRGSGGDDRPCNIISLCIFHHRLPNKGWHYLGPFKFFELFPHVWSHLRVLGWEIRNSRLRHPSFDK